MQPSIVFLIFLIVIKSYLLSVYWKQGSWQWICSSWIIFSDLHLDVLRFWVWQWGVLLGCLGFQALFALFCSQFCNEITTVPNQANSLTSNTAHILMQWHSAKTYNGHTQHEYRTMTTFESWNSLCWLNKVKTNLINYQSLESILDDNPMWMWALTIYMIFKLVG